MPFTVNLPGRQMFLGKYHMYLFRGPNEIKRKDLAIDILKRPASLTFDPLDAVRAGFVSAAELAALGYEVYDNGGTLAINKPDVDNEPAGQKVDPDKGILVNPLEGMPDFPTMSRPELHSHCEEYGVRYKRGWKNGDYIKALIKAWKKEQEE